MPQRNSSSAAISRVAVGSRLEWSTSSLPALPPSATPPLPNSTSRTAAVSARQSSTTSASAHSSAGVATALAPRSTSGWHFADERFHTTRRYPAASRRRHIGRPIRPIPAKAMVGRSDMRRLLGERMADSSPAPAYPAMARGAAALPHATVQCHNVIKRNPAFCPTNRNDPSSSASEGGPEASPRADHPLIARARRASEDIAGNTQWI